MKRRATRAVDEEEASTSSQVRRTRSMTSVKDKPVVENEAKPAAPKAKKKPTQNYLVSCRKDPQVFMHVLPHLSLADISSLLIACPHLKSVLTKYLDTGHNITVNDKLLKSHPVATNAVFYGQFGKARCLTLRKVPYGDLAALLAIFRLIARLEMYNIDILENTLHVPPRPLVELHLVNVRMEDTFFKDWIEELKPRLTYLHLDKSETYFTALGIPKFAHLKLNEVPDGPLGPGQDTMKTVVKRKKIFKNPSQGAKFALRDCRKLEYLYMGFPHRMDPPAVAQTEMRDYFVPFTSLRTLTMKAWWPVNNFPVSLEDLTVIESVDPKYQPGIEAFKLRTTNIHYFEYLGGDDEDAAEAVDEEGRRRKKPENLMLNMLNDDCLIKISEYLPVADCIAFSKTNRRVQNLVMRYRFARLKVDYATAKVLKANRFHHKMMAPWVRHMTIYSANEMLWILPLATSLKQLTLFWVQLSNQMIDNISDTLESLALVGCKKENTNQRTTPLTARQKATELTRKKMFTRLRELTVDSRLDDDCLAEFVTRGKNSIQHLRLRVNLGTDLEKYKFIWDSIGQIPTLRHVSFHRDYGYHGGVEVLENERLCVGGMYKSVGGLVTRLTVDLRGEEMAMFINGEHLKKLEEMQVSSAFKGRLNQADMKALVSVKTMRKLRVGMWGMLSPKMTDADILYVIAELPKLEHFEVPSFRPTIKFGKDLKELLTRQRRRIKFFSSMRI